jgi:hypothetical protein
MKTTMMKYALAIGLAGALASSALTLAQKQVRKAAEGVVTTAQYCVPHDDDNLIAQRVYCRDSGG